MFKGIFGGLFDFDGDGELNTLEQAAEFAFLDHLSSEADDAIDADFDTLDDDWMEEIIWSGFCVSWSCLLQFWRS